MDITDTISHTTTMDTTDTMATTITTDTDIFMLARLWWHHTEYIIKALVHIRIQISRRGEIHTNLEIVNREAELLDIFFIFYFSYFSIDRMSYNTKSD